MTRYNGTINTSTRGVVHLNGDQLPPHLNVHTEVLAKGTHLTVLSTNGTELMTVHEESAVEFLKIELDQIGKQSVLIA
ncbi:MAG: hypothetical protein KAS32_13420 [Candidatus Peribacteraceae bacterium]|nr:hypothetical protein [Candidatus Peribacteraceae bacterium]